MSDKEYKPSDSMQSEDERGEEDVYPLSAPSVPMHPYAPPSMPCEAPAPMVLEALSFITCPLCHTTYYKGDDHQCP